MRFLLLISAFVMTMTLQAQDFQFGFKAETGISWLNSSTENVAKSDGNKMNYVIGAMGELVWADNYVLTAGVGMGFAQGGTINYLKSSDVFKESTLQGDQVLQFNSIAFPEQTKVDYGLTFVEIPVSFKMKTNEIGYFTYYAELPIITLRLRTSAEADIEGLGFSSSGENINKDIKIIDAAWGLGAGVEYSISDNTRLVGGLYFNSGIIDIESFKGSNTTTRRLNLRVRVLF